MFNTLCTFYRTEFNCYLSVKCKQHIHTEQCSVSTFFYPVLPIHQNLLSRSILYFTAPNALLYKYLYDTALHCNALHCNTCCVGSSFSWSLHHLSKLLLSGPPWNTGCMSSLCIAENWCKVYTEHNIAYITMWQVQYTQHIQCSKIKQCWKESQILQMALPWKTL